MFSAQFSWCPKSVQNWTHFIKKHAGASSRVNDGNPRVYWGKGNSRGKEKLFRRDLETEASPLAGSSQMACDEK